MTSRPSDKIATGRDVELLLLLVLLVAEQDVKLDVGACGVDVDDVPVVATDGRDVEICRFRVVKRTEVEVELHTEGDVGTVTFT